MLKVEIHLEISVPSDHLDVNQIVARAFAAGGRSEGTKLQIGELSLPRCGGK
jgi:hypothetical protein